MTALVYSEADLMRDHLDLAPHVVAGRLMHGGFHADGSYQPPRAFVRVPALDAWTAIGWVPEAPYGMKIVYDASRGQVQIVPK